MKATWRLRMAAAQREVWTGAQLRRLLTEKAGLQLSAASVSALLTKQPIPAQARNTRRVVHRAGLHPQRPARHRHHPGRRRTFATDCDHPSSGPGAAGAVHAAAVTHPRRIVACATCGQQRPYHARGQCSRCYQNDPALVHRCAEKLAAQLDPEPRWWTGLGEFLAERAAATRAVSMLHRLATTLAGIPGANPTAVLEAIRKPGPAVRGAGAGAGNLLRRVRAGAGPRHHSPGRSRPPRPSHRRGSRPVPIPDGSIRHPPAAVTTACPTRRNQAPIRPHPRDQPRHRPRPGPLPEHPPSRGHRLDPGRHRRR